jgi:trimeric autotransporter adhesin
MALGTFLPDLINGGVGADSICGLGGNDTLNGLAGNDTLEGNLDNDLIRGGVGEDSLIGGLGQDTLLGGEDNDTLNGNKGKDILNGGAGSDTLNGDTGGDTLNGDTGGDNLNGGAGNDVYIVDSVFDVVNELPNEGIDTIRSSISFVLGNDQEHLVLTDNNLINGDGNSLSNKITGNSNDNILKGFIGNDTIIGGAGIDDMWGGTGNDLYIVDETFELVHEAANQGHDLVKSSATYTLSSSVEDLFLTGNAAIDGTGNITDNTIKGNNADNTLEGLGGDDTLNGGGGNDNLDGGIGDDLLNGGAGSDTLNGGLDNDTLNGGLGNDTFVFSTVDHSPFNSGDTITNFNAAIGEVIDVNDITSGSGSLGAFAAGSTNAQLVGNQFQLDANANGIFDLGDLEVNITNIVGVFAAANVVF